MYFDELDLNDYVLDALDDMQFETCTPIQESCIPHILAGRDIPVSPRPVRARRQPTCSPSSPSWPTAAILPTPSTASSCRRRASWPSRSTRPCRASPTISTACRAWPSMAATTATATTKGSRASPLGADVVIATPRRFISPHVAGQRRSLARELLHPRRGRSHARHGLLRGHPHHRPQVAAERPDHHVLGHDARQDRGPLPRRCSRIPSR